MEYRSTLTDLLNKLGDGWPSNSSPAAELVAEISRRLGTRTQIIENENNLLWFSCPLDAIKLRGFADLVVALLGGPSPHRASITRLKRLKSNLLVLCLSDDSYLAADEVLPRMQGFMVVEPAQVAAFFQAVPALEWVKGIARTQLARARLNPFGVLTIPDSNMFIGRQHELDQLYHSTASFAVAGPGRIGKSSLVQQHCRRVGINDALRRSRIKMVDFYNCDPTDERVVCRHLTTQINSNRYAHEATPEKLEKFLRHEGSDTGYGGPLELILDEVDEVCNTRTFEALAEAAKNRVCRLILCGKHELYESMHIQNHVLKNRLQLMRLQPLPEVDVRSLLIEALLDLGFNISPEDERKLVATVYRDTGGYPHLVQYYGVSIVEKALRLRTDTITFSMVEDLCNSYETLQTLAGPILDIKDPREELLALLLVSEFRDRSFSEHDFAALAHRENIQLDERAAGKLCRRLYINNVVTWTSSDRYQLTSVALSRSAERLGFPGFRLDELRTVVRTRSE